MLLVSLLIPVAVLLLPQDVTTFLAWAATPEHDERKLMGIKGMTIIGIMWMFAIYHKRLRWSTLKSRKVVLDVVN
jgi:ubiquinol-cytochrome c reductase cytochrome c1 subunit